MLVSCVYAICLLFITPTYSPTNPATQTLAPFPIYATPLGKPFAQRIEVDGKWYVFIWDGKSIDLLPLDKKDGTPPRDVLFNFIRKMLDSKMDEIERESTKKTWWEIVWDFMRGKR